MVGDASKLGPSIEREASKALAKAKIDPKPVSDQIIKGIQRGVRGSEAEFTALGKSAQAAFARIAANANTALTKINAKPLSTEILNNVRAGVTGSEKEFKDLGTTAQTALRGIAADADRAFAKVKDDGKQAGASIGAGIAAGTAKASASLKNLPPVAGKNFKRIEDDAESAGGKISASFRRILATLTIALASVQIGHFLVDATLSAQALGSAIANTQQIIKSTGGAAGLLADDVREIAQSLSLKIGVDSVDVQNAINVLLTFRSVSGPVLTEAIGLAGDLSAVFGQSLAGSATQLGKALQDPIKGVSALARVGVSFSDAQKEQIANFIAANNLAGAQGVILAELRKEVGGVAEAGADTTDKLKVAFTEIKRAAGDALIGVVDAIGPALLKTLSTLTPVFSAIGGAVAGVLNALLPSIDAIVGALGGMFAAITPALKPLGESLGAVARAAAPLLFFFGKLAAAVGEALAPAIDLLVPLVALLVPVAKILTALLPPLVGVLTTVGGALLEAIEPAAEATAKVFAEVGPLITEAVGLIADALVSLTPALVDVVSAVADLAPQLLRLLVPALHLVIALLTPLVPLIGPIVSILAGPLIAAVADVVEVLLILEPVLTALSDFLTTNPELVKVLAAAIAVWTVAQWALNVALIANPIGITIIAIAALVAGVILAWKHSEDFRKVVLAVWHAILVAGKAIGKFAVDSWHAISKFFADLAAAFTRSWRNVLTFVRRVNGFFLALPGMIGDALTAAVRAVWQFVLDVGAAFARSWRNVVGFFERLPGVLWEALKRATDRVLVGIGVLIGLAIAELIAFPGLAVHALIGLPRALNRILAAAFTAAYHAVLDGLSFIGQAIIDGVHAAGRLIVDGWNATLAFLGGLVRSLGTILSNLASLAVNGVLSAIDLTRAALATAWRLVTDGWNAVVAFVFAIPGRLGAAVAAIPGIFGGAFSAAFRFAKDQVVAGIDLVMGFINSVPDRIAALKGRMLAAGSALIRGFLNGLQNVGHFFADVAGDIVGAVKSGLNHVILKINEGIAAVDAKIPFDLPRLPQLARGGLTQRGGVAQLHPRELVLPLEDARSTDLLARAIQEAQAGLRAVGVPGAGGGDIHIQVYLGNAEITDVVNVVVDERNRALKRRVLAGPRR